MRDEEEEEGIEVEDAVSIEMNGQPPRIYEPAWQGEKLVDFDAVTIRLDGRMQSDLNWKSALAMAQLALEKNYRIFWDLELGLFDQLSRPLSDQSQFLSLTLALEHFRDSVWKEFQAATVGISLFRGSVDFSAGFRWDADQELQLNEWLEETGYNSSSDEKTGLISLFCREVAVEYISLLSSRLPDSLLVYLFFNVSPIADSPLRQLQLLNPSRFDRLQLALQNTSLPFAALGWRAPTPWGYSGSAAVSLPPLQAPTIGVCIPPSDCFLSQYFQGLEEAILALQARSIPYKLIAESQLTSQWDGLDFLIYTPTGLTGEGKRKLQGFCAAGGTPLSVGELQGLPQELAFGEAFPM